MIARIYQPKLVNPFSHSVFGIKSYMEPFQLIDKSLNVITLYLIDKLIILIKIKIDERSDMLMHYPISFGIIF